MRCKKEIDGTLKDKEEQEMKNLDDKNTRQELVRRYLNAETTLEEERLLADFLTDTDAALSQEEEDVRLLLQMSDCMEQSAISEEKANEFDRLMQRGRHKSWIVALHWIVTSAVAAVIIAFVFMTSRQHIDTPTDKSIAMVKSETEKADEKDEAQLLLPQSEDENVVNTSHDKTPVKPKKAPRRNRKHQIDKDLQIKEMTQAVNFQNEQVESYQLRPAGDATIITKTSSNGISSSYIICANDDGSSYQVVPMIEM